MINRSLTCGLNDKYLLISLERFSTTTPTFWWQKRPILSTESTPTGHINSGRARAQRDDGIHPAPGSALENSGASGSRRHQYSPLKPIQKKGREVKKKWSGKQRLKTFQQSVMLKVWPDWAICWCLGDFLKPVETILSTFRAHFLVKVFLINFLLRDSGQPVNKNLPGPWWWSAYSPSTRTIQVRIPLKPTVFL